MGTTEQTGLSDFIKSIHKKLRQETKVLGVEQAWKNHCEDKNDLEKYAKAMQELAVKHWDENSKKDSKVVSRVLWVYQACEEYFKKINTFREKEIRIAKEHLKCDENILNETSYSHIDIKYKLLDVGSCYNPFKIFKSFKVFDILPIDISPANTEVYKCDFLNVTISDCILIEDNVIKELPEGNFDVIVFSLLLEYFPSPEQRLICCLNAYNLLKTEGILVIVTPDSNHVGSNAKIIKSWRYILAKHGFTRVKYEKVPYLHCMVFRKALLKAIAQRWADVHASEGFFEQIYIPQDFQDRE